MSRDVRSQLKQATLLVRSSPLEGARLAEVVLQQARQTRDVEMMREALRVLGHNRFQQGEHAVSLQHFKDALDLSAAFVPSAGKKELADLNLMIGANYANLGESEQAFDYYSEGLRLEREISNPEGLAFALHHVGSGCRERRDFVRAEMFIREALEIYLRLNNSAGEAMCRVTLGLVAQEQGKFAEALPLLTQALAVAKQARDVRQEILARLNLAWVQLNLGEVVKSEQNFALTLEQANQIEGRHYRGWAVGGLGHVHRVRGDGLGAIRHFEESLALSLELNLLKGQLVAHEALYQTHESAGNFEKALEHYKAFHLAERSILSERAQRDMGMVAARLT
jgi:tetratricopeptide (TPR) repeat protein